MSSGPTVSDLLASRGLTPAKVEAAHGISSATVYRAKRGMTPKPLYLAGLARVLGVSEAMLSDAIARSRAAQRRKARAAS